MEIGQTLLPPVVKLLDAFSAGLKNLSVALGSGTIGAIIGFALGGPVGAAIGAAGGIAAGGYASQHNPLLGAPITGFGGSDTGNYTQHYRATGGIPVPDLNDNIKKNTDTLKALKDWLLQHIDYQSSGGGSSSLLQPAVWYDGGGGGGYSGGGSYSTGSGAANAAPAARGVASNPGRSLGTPANAGVAPMGNIPYSPSQVIGHLGGAPVLSGGPSGPNSWIAAQRAGFAKELSDPRFRAQFGAMLMAEGPTLGTAESVMNRAWATGHSLHDMVTGRIGRAFYSTYGKYIGATHLSAKMDALINQALAGSDTIRGFTDQGMPTDPNGPLGRHRYLGPLVRQHGNIYNDWQAGRFAKKRDEFEAEASKHINVPPASADKEIHLHNHVTLDGKTVARNTMKHIVGAGNHPSHSGRLSDISLTRPMSI
jgi:hypothetical protein